MSPGTTIILAIVSSNALFGFIQFLITRLFDNRNVIKRTLATVCYNQLAEKIEKSLDRGYATPEFRRDVAVLYESYKENGWNGDMDSRMAKFYALPTKNLDEIYK